MATSVGTTSTAATVIFDLLYGVAYGAWVTVQVPAFMSLAENPNEIG